jgi:hypothetical protein
MEPTVSPRDTFPWLAAEHQAQLAAFKAYAVNHALLQDVDSRLMHAIAEPAGFSHVLVYGPSGVGKSTMLQQLHRRTADLLLQPAEPLARVAPWRAPPSSVAPSPHPLLMLEAVPPDGMTFNRAAYYRAALTQLGEAYYKQWSLVDINVEQTWETKTRSKSTGRVAQFNDSPALRQAMEDALIRRGVRAVVIDEAQHLMQVASGAKLLDQLDWIKSMTNMTGVVHVLVGTYDLLNFRNLSGQAARRGHDIHFPRYQFQHEADRKAFQGAFLQLLHHQPLQADLQELLNHWYYFYERSIGCVGVLKDWLVRAVAAALRADDGHLSLARLQAHALSNAQCESMAADAHAAEHKLHYTESSREHLWSLLGMSGMAPQPIAPQGAVSSPQASPPAQAARPAPEPPKRGRVGERAPARDRVGDAPPATASTKKPQCPFAGGIALTPSQLRETPGFQVECPACGARRGIQPKTGSSRVMFPPHPIRVTRASRDARRWRLRGTIWELVGTQQAP